MLVAAVLFIAYQLLSILAIIAIAALLALVFREIVKGLGRYGVRPWMSAILIIGGFLGLGAFVWFLLAPNVIQELQRLVAEQPSGTLNELAARARQGGGLFAVLPDVASSVEQFNRFAVHPSYVDGPTIVVRVWQATCTPVAVGDEWAVRDTWQEVVTLLEGVDADTVFFRHGLESSHEAFVHYAAFKITYRVT